MSIEEVRAHAHEVIDTLRDEELRLLVAYARQLRAGHFAALTNGLEELLEDPA